MGIQNRITKYVNHLQNKLVAPAERDPNAVTARLEDTERLADILGVRPRTLERLKSRVAVLDHGYEVAVQGRRGGATLTQYANGGIHVHQWRKKGRTVISSETFLTSQGCSMESYENEVLVHAIRNLPRDSSLAQLLVTQKDLVMAIAAESIRDLERA